MTESEILFLVLFVLSLIIAVVAIVNAIKIDIKSSHAEMLLLREVMLAKAENAELLLKIEKIKKGEENE